MPDPIYAKRYPLIGKIMNFPFIKKWHGVSISAKMAIIVRATRSVTGRINHSTSAWPLTSGSGPGHAEKISPPAAGCIGIDESLTIWLDTPFTSKLKAARVLPSMLDVQLPFPLDDCFYCFVKYRRKAAGKISVLAVAARRTTIQQRLEAYIAAGIDPLIIDHEGLALWQESLREAPCDKPHGLAYSAEAKLLAAKDGLAQKGENSPRSDITRVVISLEPDHVAFVIGSGGIFLNAHSLQISVETGTEMKLEDVFLRMQRVLRAELQADKKVEWVFCGALARQPATVNALHRLLSAEWPGSFMVHKSPETFLARAISSRALAGREHACNLRQGDLTHPEILAKNRKRSARAVWTLLLAGMTLCIFNLAWQTAGSLRFKKAREEVSRLAGEIVPGRFVPYGREVEEARKTVQKRLDEFSPVMRVFAEPLSTRLAGMINAGRTARLSFTRLEITPDKITVGGTAEDWNYCEHLAKLIENSGYKTELERTENLEDNLVHFIVKGTAQP